MLLLRRELVPRRVARNAGILGMAHQVVLGLLPGRRLHGLDGPRAQRELVVGNDQAVVHPDHPAKPPAGIASAHGGVERKHGCNGLGVANIALRAVQAGGKLPRLHKFDLVRVTGQHMDRHAPAATLQAQLDRFHHTRFFGMTHAQAVGYHVQHLDVSDHALSLHPGKACGREPLLDILGRAPGGQLDGES